MYGCYTVFISPWCVNVTIQPFAQLSKAQHNSVCSVNEAYDNLCCLHSLSNPMQQAFLKWRYSFKKFPDLLKRKVHYHVSNDVHLILF
jgi:hypothetical protein